MGWFFNRDKTSVDVFWIRDESLEEFDNLLIPTYSPKPPSNGSAKSPQTWAENPKET